MNQLSYATGTRRPIQMIADDDRQSREVARFIREAGHPLGPVYRFDDVDAAMLSGPVWIEITREDPDRLERFVTAFNRADTARPATIVAPKPLLDLLAARIDSPDVELAIAPEREERLVALALMAARENSSVHDVGRQGEGERLRQLSEEVARIAATLSRMTEPPSPRSGLSAPAPGGNVPDVRAEQVRAAIRARRLREEFFDKDLFADPAWDMLLDLLAAEIAQHRVPVSSLCIAASVPATTALRWMKAMTDKGIFVRRADPHDGRRIFIELSPEASASMRRYFAALDGQLAA
ncbi:MarR family transcriptional regulator [Sphingomicrobium lutaoense]|uniref:DNA-binding MarR family transcriptional regulator n=1 Tax=Sphingomicrobium lutaoense TaxID=515949 RepID=A0A839YV61_9SPHN|nr:MarR family transcriptional regulator [Sphingomicrobium lutaoense]MBB3764101.1 DNA-binding MarR family transcriptional regulator [Sphingomicrobium lutaoense]